MKKGFGNTRKSTNHGISNIFLFLWKNVHQFEYIDDWEKLNETSLPEKEDFYSHLNKEGIADTDYMQAKGIYL